MDVIPKTSSTANTHLSDLPKRSSFSMSGLAIIVGIASALGALMFHGLINFIFNLTFSGTINFDGIDQHIQPSIWGMGVILIPVLGAVVVTWLTNNFAPEAKGHGVPEVMYAIHYKDGIIRPIVAVIKAFASAICIGTGGSGGREGPIIQISAAFGATLGQIVTMPVSQRIILIAAGGGAGIAATFNAPLAGVTFAIELMLITINAISIGLVTIAVITSTMVVYLLTGDETIFIYTLVTQDLNINEIGKTLLLCIPFAIFVGMMCSVFIYSLYWLEDNFDKWIKNHYLRHCLGMLGVGITFYLFMFFYGHYYVAGIGYSTIQDLLNNFITNPWLLILLFAGKLLTTGITLGSGGSGGVFSPSLYLGATLGALYGFIVNYLFPSLQIEPVIFVLAGMAGMVGGTTGAFVTAILMMFEITRDYNNVLPMMITVAIADIVRTYFSKESIYTLKLKRRGFTLPHGLQPRFSKDD